MILIEDGTKLERLYASRRILGLLIMRDLKIRYADSALGYLWSVLEPLSMALVYLFVFTVFGRHVGEPPYILFLLTGQLPWAWFNGSVTGSLRALRSEAGLVRSTNLPRELWIIRIVCSKGMEFLFAVPIVVLFAIGFGKGIGFDIVFLPLAVAMQFVLMTGLGLLLAPLTVLVPDVDRIVKVFMRMLFYLSPVLYGVGDIVTKHKNGTVTSKNPIPAPIQRFFEANPLAGIFSLYRSCLFPDQLHWQYVAEAGVGTVIIFVVGVVVFARLESSVLKEI